jgi:hypothetical protein
MIVEIDWQLVLIQSRMRFRDILTQNIHNAPLSNVSLSSGTSTSTGATFFMLVSQAEQKLLSPDFSALRHEIQPLSPHLECTGRR